MPLSESQLNKALEDARKQGLPHDWILTLDDEGRKKWTSPGLKPRSFKYLQRALDFVQGKTKAGKQAQANGQISAPQSNGAGSGTKKSKSKSKSKPANRKRSATEQSSSSKKSKKSSRGNSNSPVPTSSNGSTSSSSNHNTSSSKSFKKYNTQKDPAGDPETTLDVPPDYPSNPYKYHRHTGTVHWDPHSTAGLKVGHRIRVWDAECNYYKSGRVLRYDPISHKHKIHFFGSEDEDSMGAYEEWLNLDHENVQIGGRFVWALVKGFPWWPAQVLHCSMSRIMNAKGETGGGNSKGKKRFAPQAARDGYVLVEFFDSDEVATIKDTNEFIKDFNGGQVDKYMKKNKKKRNEKAVQSARHEEAITRDVRNDAARFYAEKAFECVNAKANFLLGCKVEIFRSDINYPTGEYLVGRVRMYSQSMKKYLVAYDADLKPSDKKKYEASWVSFSSQRVKVLERLDEAKCSSKNKSSNQRCKYVVSDTVLYPFTFGNEEVDGDFKGRCRNCVGVTVPDINSDSKDTTPVLQCSKCRGLHHPGCLDPPLTNSVAESILRSGKEWFCQKCIRCTGCRELEIAFGPKTMNRPSSLYLPTDETLQLCEACIPLYDRKNFCPVCAHVWDDVEYEKVQKKLMPSSAASTQGKKRVALTDKPDGDYGTKPGLETASVKKEEVDDANDIASAEEDLFENSFRWMPPSCIPDSSFYPENNVWSYHQDNMLSCENCNLWVHAGCAGMTKSEYENSHDHPIYGREFLCRSCSYEKCKFLWNKLKEEDDIGMSLFAVPVTDKVAHNYRDIIRNPMDLETMRERVWDGNYRNYAWLREAFELMVYNALLFNPPRTAIWNEAKRFYQECKKKVFFEHGKGAPPSKYKAMIKDRFDYAEKMLQAEKDRVKADKTAEKKDLVAGDQVLSVKLGPLVAPPDPPSCIPTTVVRLSPLDAFYSSWLECCFSCGSSGAIDTMLFCVDCGECYHSFCANAPIHSMNEAAVANWRCPNCKLCEITGEVTSDETKLLYCEMCDRAFSIDLIDPPLKEVPTGLWICGQCVDCVKCNNTVDKGKVNRKYWSRDPSMCFACGGCDGLEIESLTNSRCSVCKKISRCTEGLKQCSSCDAFIHAECDKSSNSTKLLENMASQGGDEPEKYVCPRCLKRKADALKRREQRAKAKAKENKSGIKKPITKKETVPARTLTKEEQKLEALKVAMKDAQSRGLPDGWRCFYGSANRKRWRSPSPNSRVFDSIPKALQYVERLKKGLDPSQKRKKSVSNVPEFKFFQLKLDLEPDWTNRESGYDESTSLMSDAEVLLKILESKIKKDMALLFDTTGNLFLSSPHVHCLPKWVVARAGRFVRFVRRLRNRSTMKNKRKRGNQGSVSSRSAQTVVCKMTSAFLYCACIMFKMDIKTTITSWKKMRSLLVPIDEGSGTIDLKLEIKKKKVRLGLGWFDSNDSEKEAKPPDYADLPGFDDDSSKTTTKMITNGPFLLTKEPDTLNETMAKIPYHQLESSSHNISQIPLTLQESRTVNSYKISTDDNCKAGRMPQMQNKVPSERNTFEASNLKLDCNEYQASGSVSKGNATTHHLMSGKFANEMDIASTLLSIASPSRTKQSSKANFDQTFTSSGLSHASKTHEGDKRSNDMSQILGNKSIAQMPDNNGISTVDTAPQPNASSLTSATSRPISQERIVNSLTNSITNSETSSFLSSNLVPADSRGFIGNAAMALSTGTNVSGIPTQLGNFNSTASINSTASHTIHPVARIVKSTDVFGKGIVGNGASMHIDSNRSDRDLLHKDSIAAEKPNSLPAANSSVIDVHHTPADSPGKIYEGVPRTSDTSSIEAIAATTRSESLDADNCSLSEMKTSRTIEVSSTKAFEMPGSAKYENTCTVPIASEPKGHDTNSHGNTEEKESSSSPHAQTLSTIKSPISKSGSTTAQGPCVSPCTFKDPKTLLKMEPLPGKPIPVPSEHDALQPISENNKQTDLTSECNPSNGIGNVDDSTKSNLSSQSSCKKSIDLPWHSHEFVKVAPLVGWKSNSIENVSEINWIDSRTCCLCHISGDDDAGLKSDQVENEDKYEKLNGSGRLLPLPGGGWVHTGCAIWSSETWENPVGVLNGVAKAKGRSSALRCFGCGRPGATLGCHRANCKENYHYACAKACGVVFTSTHKHFCKHHKQFAKDELVTDFHEPMKKLCVVDDKAEPDPDLCYRSGTLIVHSLGEIQHECDGFHSKHYITPPGFSSTRIFWSFVKPRTRTVYVMRITRSKKNSVNFLITAADAPTETFQDDSVTKVYNEIMKRVMKLNKPFFSEGDMFSVLPMARSKKNRKAFCLNASQFFGFGINFIREALETNANAVACAVPLSDSSIQYQFCFKNPTEQAVMDLQRKRAAMKAERALENTSGCARTEGSGAFDKSKGSGRITRALVHKTDEDNHKALTKGTGTRKEGHQTAHKFESNQKKYRDMKSVPMEKRLAAKRSHIHGWGLFATVNYPKDSMIAEYMGEGVSQPIADKREKKYEILGMGSCYMFRLDFHEIVDATQIGCMARFMNHCCAANAYADVISVTTEKGLEKKIVVFANQDIKAGDEITYDYKFPVEDGSLRCTCGAPNCIGRMN